MSWDTHSEKLRCHIVLSDDVARYLSPRAGDAFFRAFIVEDRATGEIRLVFRYRYKNPDARNWFRVISAKRGDEAVADLAAGIECVLITACEKIGRPIAADKIARFYPPDDGGDPRSTLIWLEMHDLIELTDEHDPEYGDAFA